MKSGNLNFLEPSGSLQACNGTDLPFILPFNNTTEMSHLKKFSYRFWDIFIPIFREKTQ
jgi:hypothetical protein